MIRLSPVHREATAAQVDAALAQLDDAPGAYFGCDAGVAGLHPLQATLLVQPAVALYVFGDGLEVQVLTQFGAGLLSDPGTALAHWQGESRRGMRHPIVSLRAFLASFAPSPDVLLLGALSFEAWKLAGAGGNTPLGVLYFAQDYFRRDAQGRWQQVTFARGGVLAAATVQAPAAPAAEPADDYPPGGYAQMVQRALVHLREQPLVSLTLSQSYRRRASMSPAQGFARLRKANPAPAVFFVNDGRGERLFGASPDLQLAIRGNRVQAFPVCGTVARGAGPVGEAESLRELVNEDVDAASLAVCSDALRNDLAPLCKPGSLRLTDRRRPMSLATVVHTVDALEGELRDGADAWDAIVATAAPVMLTGTPREHALSAIGRLEASPRGWYGGLMVQVQADGDALVGTILRAAVLRDGVAEVRTGGDLMADSDPAREERESRLKSLSLWRALGVEGAAPVPAAVAAIAGRPLPVAVHLVHGADPFPAASRDLLEGMGLLLADEAAVTIATGELEAAPKGPLVAVADAAFTVLREAGFAVGPILPQQGRVQRCSPTSTAPWAARSFLAGCYARHGWRDAEVAIVAGWEVWARGEDGRPLALANATEKKICLLFRPDSVLSDADAVEAFRASIASVAP
jgi:anthranilate/para-aminobenzoate synthase component I